MGESAVSEAADGRRGGESRPKPSTKKDVTAGEGVETAKRGATSERRRDNLDHQKKGLKKGIDNVPSLGPGKQERKNVVRQIRCLFV